MKKNISQILSLFGLILLTSAGAQARVSQTIEINPISMMQTENKDIIMSYHFGRVQVGMTSSVYYNLSNKGDTPIDVSIEIRGAGFDADSNCPKTLEAKQKCSTRIVFWPTFEGQYAGRLVWLTTGGNIILDLWGQGARNF